MTQPPYYPQQPYGQPPMQQPQYPQYQQPMQQPAYPQYPQQVGGWPQMPQGQQVPQVPLAEGTLDDFFDQPSAGGGPAVSWKDKANGYTVAGIVARAIGKGDVQQQTDPQTKQPKFFRDGRPQFVMKVPLRVQPSQEFPEGEAQLYVRGQLRDELVRAMTEARSRFDWVFQLLHSVTVLDHEDRQARARVYASEWAQLDGRATLLYWLYHDDCAAEDGQWRFARRTIDCLYFGAPDLSGAPAVYPAPTR